MKTIYVTLDDINETTETVVIEDNLSDDEIFSLLGKKFGKQDWFALIK